MIEVAQHKVEMMALLKEAGLLESSFYGVIRVGQYSDDGY